MLRTLKIGTKLSLLLAALLLATLATGTYGVVALRQSQANTAASLRLSADLMAAMNNIRSAEVAFKFQVQEFKDILLRGHERSDFEHYSAALPKRVEQARKQFAETQAAMVRLGIPTAALDDAIRAHSRITTEYTEALQEFSVEREDTSHSVDAMVRGKDRPLTEKIEAVVAAIEKFSTSESARLADASAAAARQAITSLLAMVILLAIGTGIAGAVLIRSLLRELGGEPAYAKDVAQSIAQGDLALDVQVRPGDRGSMVLAMKEMAQSLRSLVGEVARGAHEVADGSAQIAQGNADLSQRTEEQAGTLEETAAQMEELTTTVTRNAENARQASLLAAQASAVARRGGDVVGEVVATMDGITDSSRRIADIISVIDGIAFQTNILALNAAVEAARAGEQGRGFAVVASEVRNLAQRSAGAAKEIKGLIGDSVGKVEAGARLVDSAGKTMDDIVDSVKKVSELVAEIAAASQEQSAGIEQVNAAMTQMDQVVQQNASLVEEASAATESMKALAEALQRTVGRFHLGSQQAAAADREAGSPAIRYRPTPVPAGGRALAGTDWKEF